MRGLAAPERAVPAGRYQAPDALIKTLLTPIPKGASIYALYPYRSGSGAVQNKLFRTSIGSLSFQRNPLNWLTVGGVVLIASIVIGTAFAVVNFRQRALENSERELEN